MHCLSQKISSEFVKRHIISPDQTAIYQYGLELLLSTIITSVSILFLSCTLDSLFIGLLYFLITIPLRLTCGGYHAKTYRICFLISNLTYTAVSCIVKILSSSRIPPIVWLILLVSSTAYIRHYAPVRHNHHPVSEKTLYKNKILADKFLILDCAVLLILLSAIPYSFAVHFAIVSIVSVAVLIIPAQKKGEKLHVNADSFKDYG